jgi:hypothetical protein
MKKYLLPALLLALAAGAAHAQTTVVTFDTPPCSGNGVATYAGINFSLSPWNCANPGLSGQTGTSISWYEQITTGKFAFVSPQILESLSAATASGSGTLTITTDAGETISRAINTKFQTIQTGFTKAAAVVAVTFPGGWTIQLDNLTYVAPSSTGTNPPPGTLTASASLMWDDGTPVTGSVQLIQLESGATKHPLGTFPIDSTGTGKGTITIDLTQGDPLSFQVNLLSTSGQQVGLPATFGVMKVMFPTTSTGINAKIVLTKASTTIKSFNIGLTP